MYSLVLENWVFLIKKTGNSIWCKGASYENGHFNFIMHMAW